VQIEAKIDDKEVRKLFSQLERRMGNLLPVMKTIGDVVRTSAVRNFEVGGRPKWAPLSPRTILKKGHSRPLIDSSILMGSINYKAHSDRVGVGTNRVYARIHQLGGKAGRGKKTDIPARPFLGVQPEDVVEIRETLYDYLLVR